MSGRKNPSVDVLVFEPEHGGHHPAYVHMLAIWLTRRAHNLRVSFAVTDDLRERLRLEDRFEFGESPLIDVRPIAAAAARTCYQGPLSQRSLARMRLINALVRDTGAGHVVSTYLDSLQLSLALGLRPPLGATISGILFRPSVHSIYSQQNGVNFRERVRDKRKLIMYRLMLRNPSLTRVMSLDPYFVPYASSTFRTSARIVAIPDPVVESPAVAEFADVGADLRKCISEERATFTLFGSLTERKGVLQVLDALHRLPAKTRAKVRVVLAGRIDPAIATQVHDIARSLQNISANAEYLRIVDRLLTTAELSWLVRESSVILAPYQRFVGSSGVLAWAAAHRRPVIAQEYGLVGALVRDHRLGLAINTSDPNRIAAAVMQLADARSREMIAADARCSEFLCGRTADDFATAVFAGILSSEDRRS